jgi:ferrous iron transport protein A
MKKTQSRKLGELRKGTKAVIVQVGNPDTPSSLVNRLLEVGLIEGSTIEVLHEAPFGGDPIAVLVRGVRIALRRQEADIVEVIIREE